MCGNIWGDCIFSVRSSMGRTFCLTGDMDNQNTNTTDKISVQDNYELFKEALDNATLEIEQDIEDIQYTPSRKHKIRMNRIFRENVGGKFLPYPEVDSLYEKIRSRVIIKLKLNGCKKAK